MEKHRIHLAAFLLLTSAPLGVLAQGPAPSAPAMAQQPPSESARGAYLFIYRTPDHVHYSSVFEFQEVKKSISEYLAGQHIEIRRVEERDPSMENLTIVGSQGMSDVFQRAQTAGASYVLHLSVDRPKHAWGRLEMKCFDLSGNELWSEFATESHPSFWTAKSGVENALKVLQEKLAARIGQPGLVVHSGETASTASLPAESRPGSAPSSGAQAAAREAAGGESARAGRPSEAPSATVTLPEGTAVQLVLLAPVDSKTARAGDKVNFRVLGDVKMGDLVVIPRKASACGIVSEVILPERGGQPGRITIKAETVSLPTQQTAALRGLWVLQAGNKKWSSETQAEAADLTIQTLGLGIPFLPLLALKHGDPVVLPAGMEFPAALDHPVVMERTALTQVQRAPAEKHHGNSVVTIYHLSIPPDNRPVVYCGKAEVAYLRNGRKFQLTLPLGTYWFRSYASNKVPLTLEEGGQYYLRVVSVIAEALSRRYSQVFQIRDPDIGEIEASAAVPLDPKDIKDIAKINPARLTAAPK